MKKFCVILCAVLPALNAFAYYDDSDAVAAATTASALAIIIWVVLLVIYIILLVRWWQMTSDVKQIRQQLANENPKLTYMVAIGDMEQAQKAALKSVVDLLLPIYESTYISEKALSMNQILQSRLPRIQQLGITLPDYVTSGEKFIDYLNALTGNNVTYQTIPNIN